MADLTTFPIPTEVLDPADWPEFKGRTILNGEVDPTDEGEDGDFYLNTATQTMFGPKAAGAWPAGVLLKGADGTNGTNGVDGAPGDAPPITTATITAGNLATPLDGNHRTLQLSEDVSAGWAAPLPSGGDASMRVYWCSLDILPPSSGGPYALSIPAAWLCFGPLDTIALQAGDDPIAVVLRTWGASGIAYSAGWVTA